MSKFIKLHNRKKPMLVPVSNLLLVWVVGHMTYIKIKDVPEQIVDESIEEIEALLNFDPAVADIVMKGKEL
jgi:DNA-binding LytR/AlgR family response regulator